MRYGSGCITQANGGDPELNPRLTVPSAAEQLWELKHVKVSHPNEEDGLLTVINKLSFASGKAAI